MRGNMIIDELKAEYAYLKELSKKMDHDIISAPPGKLRITRTTSSPVYYHRKTSSDASGDYIKSADRDIARQLAQKDYAKKSKILVERRLEFLQELIGDYENHDMMSILTNCNPARQRLISPYIISNEEYAKQWLEEPFIPNSSYQEHLIFETANGELVRSKSEVIIADTLLRLGIPYKYEAPFHYSKHNTIYPDFTALNVITRKVVYIEHFGLMHSESYRDSFFDKLRKYYRAGLVQGRDLIFTYEDDRNPFDISIYKKNFEELLLKG